jgi:uncharacterized glyoxalase superfamily protein PhnB
MSSSPAVTGSNAGTIHSGPLDSSGLSASFTVKDLQRSLAWYRDVVGFTVGQEFERDGVVRAIEVLAGSVRFVIGQDDGAKGWDRKKGEGFSLQLTTTQDIDSIARRVTSHGYPLELEPTDMPWGVRLFRVKDPDGFNLSVSSPR